MLRLVLPADPGELRLPPAGAAIASLRGQTMGTYWTVSMTGSDMPPLLDLRRGIIAILDEIIASMSHWDPASRLSAYNAASPGSWVDADADLIQVLNYALSVAAESDGAYDPTIGALVDLWGFGPAGGRDDAPSDAEIVSARAQAGWQRVRVDAVAGRIFQPGGIRLDLSSVAKGFAVDQVSHYLTAQGVTSHLVDIGGELRGWGIKSDAQPWWVMLEQPLGRSGQPGGTPTRIALHGLSVATSGDSRRFLTAANGTHLSHSLDPRTGYPVPDRLAAVTVLHQDAMVADALATALTVMGYEVGLDWAAARNIAALFALRDRDRVTEILSPALAALAEAA